MTTRADEQDRDWSRKLLPQVFAWARSAHPIQPLTSGVWHGGDWSTPSQLNAIERIQLEQSDVITFHNYDWPEEFEQRVDQLRRRMAVRSSAPSTWRAARVRPSTACCRSAKKHDVGMINWGFVDGKTQTDLPWDSWQQPYTAQDRRIWFHDLLHADGTPYRQREADILRSLNSAPRFVVPEEAKTFPVKAPATQ